MVHTFLGSRLVLNPGPLGCVRDVASAIIRPSRLFSIYEAILPKDPLFN